MTETKPPEDVKTILKETCFDCHSDVTRYPWYNNITPVNYWLAAHIKNGKKSPVTFRFRNKIANV